MPTRPTTHELRAALSVARSIDEGGNWISDVRGSYLHIQNQGEHRSEAFIRSEAILEMVGLLVRQADRLVATDALRVLARLEDDAAITALLRLFDTSSRSADTGFIGSSGELAVLALCRDELVASGRTDLLSQLVHMSLLDDAAGYDIRAPMLKGQHRLLEVKTSTSHPAGLAEFFISRNEYDTGTRDLNWALVACSFNRASSDVSIVGWCRALRLRPYLPSDGNGRWTEARVKIPRTVLIDGIPPAA